VVKAKEQRLIHQILPTDSVEIDNDHSNLVHSTGDVIYTDSVKTTQAYMVS